MSAGLHPPPQHVLQEPYQTTADRHQRQQHLLLLSTEAHQEHQGHMAPAAHQATAAAVRRHHAHQATAAVEVRQAIEAAEVHQATAAAAHHLHARQAAIAEEVRAEVTAEADRAEAAVHQEEDRNNLKKNIQS